MPATSTRARNILVVDDDPDLRDVLKQVLEEEGHRVLVARNGREALQVLRESHPPQLILLDLMMPTMDGLSFRKAQLEDQALASIPVVILSAMNELCRRAEEAPVQATLAKPVSIDALLDAVERFARG